MEQFGLVGREREVADLDRAVLGSGVGVVLTGERGVGRTALWDGFLTRLTDRVSVSRITATGASRSIPFGAVAPLLERLPSSPLNQAQMLSVALTAFRERAGGEPLILGVDDVHMVDDASATLIDQLVRAEDVILVGTGPSEFSTSGWLLHLMQLGRVRSYPVRPLDRSQLAALVSEVLDGEVDEAVQSELWRLSRGIPLVARQLIDAALQSDVLVKRGLAWATQGPFVATGPLGETLDVQLAQRVPGELEVLELAAVGGLVELELLEEVGGDGLVEALEGAELIRVDSHDGRVAARLQRPLLSEHIQQSMPLTRRRRISRTLAEWVDSTGARRDGDALRVAAWDLGSGVTPRPEVATLAAREALAAGDPGLAERLSRLALVAGDDFEARLTLGQALFELGRHADADEVLSETQELASGDDELARAAIARCEVLALGRADLSAAVDVGVDVAAMISDADWVDELAVELARLALAAGDPSEAVSVGQRIEARETASAHAVVTSLTVSVPAKVMLGRFDGAVADADRGVALIDDGAAATVFARDQLLMAKAEALLYHGQLTEAIAIADTGCRTAEERNLSMITGMWQAVLGRAVLLTGDVARSLSLYDRSIAALTTHDPLALLSRVRARGALAAATAGDVARIEETLAGIDHAFVEADYRVHVLVERAKAWVLALEGDCEAAAAHTQKAATSAISNHHFSMAAVALHDATRFGDSDLVVKQLGDLASRFDGTLLPAFARHAFALSAADSSALEAVADTYATIGANLLAAEATTQLVSSQEGVIDDSTGRRSQARADALLAGCPGACTPIIAHREPVLTTRQNQIARLACYHTNPEIAVQLSISVRTVENHLAGIYNALHIHHRADLLAIFGPASASDT